MTADPWSAFLAAPDAIPRDRLVAAVKAAYALHEPTTTTNGVILCPFCTRSFGVLISAPCDAAKDILAALNPSKESRDG
ncbi:hypothetical protein [Actinomadura rubrisoli]|uniref:Uncharacterized protein n=1 Tax=Actinomadura rubrisoli TaxID=2530368 RepID=A0A4R5CF23_9ACTN|nr:hypothetical protein [Actinomadura rubrisoli]TDD97599.1 hypothetical protein E1298_00790 [Actinomadura rubrisoli]